MVCVRVTKWHGVLWALGNRARSVLGRMCTTVFVDAGEQETCIWRVTGRCGLQKGRGMPAGANGSVNKIAAALRLQQRHHLV